MVFNLLVNAKPVNCVVNPRLVCSLSYICIVYGVVCTVYHKRVCVIRVLRDH